MRNEPDTDSLVLSDTDISIETGGGRPGGTKMLGGATGVRLSLSWALQQLIEVRQGLTLISIAHKMTVLRRGRTDQRPSGPNFGATPIRKGRRSPSCEEAKPHGIRRWHGRG